MFSSMRAKRALAPALTLNPTRARFEELPGRALVFQALDNIIQPGTFKACEMLSISVRLLSKASLREVEGKQTDSGVCTGGELILEKR